MPDRSGVAAAGTAESEDESIDDVNEDDNDDDGLNMPGLLAHSDDDDALSDLLSRVNGVEEEEGEEEIDDSEWETDDDIPPWEGAGDSADESAARPWQARSHGGDAGADADSQSATSLEAGVRNVGPNANPLLAVAGLAMRTVGWALRSAGWVLGVLTGAHR